MHLSISVAIDYYIAHESQVSRDLIDYIKYEMFVLMSVASVKSTYPVHTSKGHPCYYSLAVSNKVT